MRRCALVVVLVGLGCDPKDDPPATPEAPAKRDLASAEVESPRQAPEPIDEARRFVKEDFDHFMKQYPDAVSAAHKELVETCVGAGCLEHKVSASVGPFQGVGTRYLVPLWLRGCLTGSAKACLSAGRTYQSSRHTRSPETPTHEGFTEEALDKKFRQYIALACDLDASECEQWADYRLGDEVRSEADITRAVARLKTGCESGAPGSCAALARHAANTPLIGDARPWWRDACKNAPGKDSRYCASYANALFATGAAKDRAEAAKALGPICDPDSATWAEACKGDPAQGIEACAFTYLEPQGKACVALAKKLPQNQALRLYAALCVGSLLTEANDVGEHACSRAKELAGKLGRSAAYKENIRKRTCEVAEMQCLDDTSDVIACEAAREQCVGDG